MLDLHSKSVFSAEKEQGCLQVVPTKIISRYYQGHQSGDIPELALLQNNCDIPFFKKRCKEMPVYKSFHKPTCFGHQMAAGSIFPIYRIRRMDHRSIHPATMSGSDEPADNVVSLRGDVDLGFLYNPATWHQNFH